MESLRWQSKRDNLYHNSSDNEFVTASAESCYSPVHSMDTAMDTYMYLLGKI